MIMNIILTTIILVALAGVLVFDAIVYYQVRKHDNRGTERTQASIDSGARSYNEYDIDERFHIAPLGNLDEEYMNLFSNPPMEKPARRGKSAYLRDAYHERIRQIVNALNIEGVNISSYVDMVLTNHLMRYENQIDRLIHNCYGKSRKLTN